MSRDQRPGRAVMVGSAPERPQPAPVAAAALPAPVKRRSLLWSIAFLLGCVGGSVAVALLVPASIW